MPHPGRIDLVTSPVVDGYVRDNAPAVAQAIFDADVEDILVVAHSRGPGYLVAALEILVGIKDAVTDVEGEVMDLERCNSLVRIGGEQLVEHSLVAVGCNAPLPACLASGQRDHCNRKQQQ